jgi:hypothetical protein
MVGGFMSQPSTHQRVQLWAFVSEDITQPSLKEPAGHCVMLPDAGSQ